jgi:inorganic pyrophosphatase
VVSPPEAAQLEWFRTLGALFRRHPWHGVSIGPEAPERVTCYIEIVPTDTVKYEADKATGYLKVDRPQKYSSICPTLYGLIPQTYCGDLVAGAGLAGDGDPMDVCVLTEKHFTHGDILVEAIPVGGLRLLDRQQADDKIIAVLKDDAVSGRWRDIADCPPQVIERLRHYFLTYKDVPGAESRACEISAVYGRQQAHEVIRRSRQDYRNKFGNLEDQLRGLLEG